MFQLLTGLLILSYITISKETSLEEWVDQRSETRKLSRNGISSFVGYIGLDQLSVQYEIATTTLTILYARANRLSNLRRTITTADEVKLITNNFFSAPSQLYDSLEWSFTPDAPKGSVSISPERGSLYLDVKAMGTVVRWTILLKQTVASTGEEIEFLHRRVDPLTPLVMHPTFTKDNNQFITMSADVKTLKYLQNGWKGFVGEQTFKETGLQAYYVKVLTTQNRNMMIGVSLEGTNLASGSYAQSTAWMFHLYNGYIYCSGTTFPYYGNRLFVVPEDIIGIKIDMNNKMMSVELNEINLGPACRLNTLNANQLKMLRPAIDFSENGQSVQFL